MEMNFKKLNSKYVWIFLLLIVLIGGVRFSDGSALLAIARGATAESPSFSGSGALQYIWDSPLKVLSLRFLPPNIYGVALFFGLLSVLPVTLLLTRDRLPFLAYKLCTYNHAIPKDISPKYRRWRRANYFFINFIVLFQ